MTTANRRLHCLVGGSQIWRPKCTMRGVVCTKQAKHALTPTAARSHPTPLPGIYCAGCLWLLFITHVLVSYQLFLASPDASEREGKYSSTKRNDSNSNASTTIEGKRGYHDKRFIRPTSLRVLYLGPKRVVTIARALASPLPSGCTQTLKTNTW